LASHDSIDVDFLLAAIESWDGADNGGWSPDFFHVEVDGISIFHETLIPHFACEHTSGDFTR
jgi:hypothetical protein